MPSRHFVIMIFRIIIEWVIVALALCCMFFVPKFILENLLGYKAPQGFEIKKIYWLVATVSMICIFQVLRAILNVNKDAN